MHKIAVQPLPAQDRLAEGGKQKGEGVVWQEMVLRQPQPYQVRAGDRGTDIGTIDCTLADRCARSRNEKVAISKLKSSDLLC